MLTEVEDDLFNYHGRVLAHGVSCMGVMGAGIALEIRNRFPLAFADYTKLCSKYEREEAAAHLLGTVQAVDTGGVIILNCFTQAWVGTRYREVSYDAVDRCMRQIGNKFSDYNPVAMPRIGAGLAGGSWNVIREIIRNAANGRFHAKVFSLPKREPKQCK
jgi:O-acetyl-ADP-ribose deacetylase (regulator of RNase III)